jgi:hypothetical protein
MGQSVSQNDEIAKIALEKSIGVKFSPPFVGLIVENAPGVLVAALIFNNFDEINVDLSISVFSSVGVTCVRDICRYTFGRLKVKRVSCVTSIYNKSAIRSLRSLGFECEGVLKERLPSGDAFLFALLASKQRFLRLSNGQHAEPPRSVCDRSSANREQRTNG